MEEIEDGQQKVIVGKVYLTNQNEFEVHRFLLNGTKVKVETKKFLKKEITGKMAYEDPVSFEIYDGYIEEYFFE